MIPNIYQISNQETLPPWAQAAMRDPKTGSNRFAHFLHPDGVYDFYGTREMALDLKKWRETFEENPIYDEPGAILTPETITPYLSAFSKGFHEGYGNFWKDVNHDGNIRNEKANVEKILSYSKASPDWPITNRISSLPSPCITIESWFQAGVGAGKWYNAWYVMIENPGMFGMNQPIQKNISKEKPLLGRLEWLALYRYYTDDWVVETTGKLKQHFNRWIRDNERTGEMAHPSKTKVRHGIEKREQIIELLPKEKQQKAVDELKAFKANNKEYI